MKAKPIAINKQFVGRAYEHHKLTEIGSIDSAVILIVYGRRRVGKTELLEQTYRKRNILKFEGIAGKSEQQQMVLVMQQLAHYVQEPLLGDVTVKNWLEVFQYIFRYTKTGTWTVYFEEVQWLACYQDNFINELKFVWDNYFRHNAKLLLILCGSAPSFMINQVMHSKALYNRSQYELLLQPLNLIEAQKMLPRRSKREVMDAYLTIGGIPEYLQRINHYSSVMLGICHESFVPNGFFIEEYSRIFTSSMADNPYYKKIIEFLGKQHFATRKEILKHTKLSSSGYITNILNDLQLCQFICRYVPYNLNEDSMLARYSISDPYLQFYSKFIQPYQTAIQDGKYRANPMLAMKKDTYYKWLGFAFERFCRHYHYVIARILGFPAVHYQSGVFFNRATLSEDPGYQLDLVFDRDDHIITICEIKYLQTTVNSKIIADFEKKLALFPNKKQKTIEKVLITTLGQDKSLEQQAYFDRVITLDDVFNANYW